MSRQLPHASHAVAAITHRYFRRRRIAAVTPQRQTGAYRSHAVHAVALFFARMRRHAADQDAI